MRRPTSGGACPPQDALVDRHRDLDGLSSASEGSHHVCCCDVYHNSSRHGHKLAAENRSSYLVERRTDTRPPRSAFYYLLAVCILILITLSCASLLFATNFDTFGPTSPRADRLSRDVSPRWHSRRQEGAQQRGRIQPDGYRVSPEQLNEARPTPAARRRQASLHSERPRVARANHEQDPNSIHHDRPKHAKRRLLRKPEPEILFSPEYRKPASTTRDPRPQQEGPFGRRTFLNFFTGRFAGNDEINSYNVDDIFSDDDDDDTDDDDDPDSEMDSDDFVDLATDDADDDDDDDEEAEEIHQADASEIDADQVDLTNELSDFDGRRRIGSSAQRTSRKQHENYSTSSVTNEIAHHAEPHRAYERVQSGPKWYQIFGRPINVINRKDGTNAQHHPHAGDSADHPRKSEPRESREKSPQQGTASTTSKQNSRRPSSPSPQVPYQSPVVVSISDNSYVSASPVVTSGDNYNELAYGNNRSGGVNMTTSTTATTTSNTYSRNVETFSVSSSQGSAESAGRATGPKGDRGRVTAGSRFNARTPIVFSEHDRYNVSNSSLSAYKASLNEINGELAGEQPVVLADVGDKLHTNTIGGGSAEGGRAPPGGDLTMQQASGERESRTFEREPEDEDEDAHANEDTANESDSRMSGGSSDPGEATGHRLAESLSGYSNLIVGPKNELPSRQHRYWHDSHLASIQMVQEEPSELDHGGINSAIIAILFGMGATGMLVLVVGLKMRTIRERVAYRGRRRSLVPDTDFLINTIPIRDESFHSLDRRVLVNN